jgi:hypothetical protein
MVGCRPTTTNHDIDTRIFTVATTTTADSSAPVDAPAHAEPYQAVSGKCSADASGSPSCAASAYSRPRSTSTASTTSSTVASTKYAAGAFDRENGDRRCSSSDWPFFGWIRMRRAMSARMPRSDAHAMASVSHSHGARCPSSGSAKRGSTTCPYPVASVKNSTGNDTMTAQCATLTTGVCWNRPWPTISRSTRPTRGPTGRRRSVGVGPPIRTVRTIAASPRAKTATPTTVARTTSTRQVSCRASTRSR